MLDEIVEILKYESCRFSETVTTQCLDPRGTSHGVDRACMMWQPLLYERIGTFVCATRCAIAVHWYICDTASITFVYFWLEKM